MNRRMFLARASVAPAALIAVALIPSQRPEPASAAVMVDGQRTVFSIPLESVVPEDGKWHEVSFTMQARRPSAMYLDDMLLSSEVAK